MFALSSSRVAADAFNPMVDTITYSKNGKIKVFSNTNEKTYAVRNKTRLWAIERYVKFGCVSDDGKYFVAIYGGGNLVPFDADDQLILLTFYRDGERIREIKLKDIIEDRSQLVETTSHLYWGDPVGFAKSNKFRVRRVDGKIFSFDLPSY
jgi:hypothetical protein